MMPEFSKMLEEYRNGERSLPTYDELAALLDKPLPVRVFQSAEQNKQLARDAQAILNAEAAREGTAAQGDAIRKVEVDNQGPLGIVTKTTYALANSKDAEAAAFYRYLRDEVIGDDPEAIGMDKAKKPGLDAACRAAIAAKAAS